MSATPNRFRYTRWDGTQQIDAFTAEELLEAMADDLLAEGDVNRALQRLFRWGIDRPDARMPGFRELLERLRERRQQILQRYDPGSVLQDLNERLEDVIQTERAGIERRVQEGREHLARAQGRVQRGEQPGTSSETAGSGSGEPDEAIPDPALQQLLERMAQQKLSFLDQLPPDPAGRIRALSDYEFMDPEARRKFQELLASLQRQVLEQTFQGLQQAIQNLTPEAIAELRTMLRDLNELLQEYARGGQPDIERFKHRWGHYFGRDFNSVEELLDHLAQQMAAVQSLLDSLPPEMRQQLEEALDAALRDPALQQELRQLGQMLGQLMPRNPYRQAQPFSGSEELTLGQALRLMEQLREMQQLEEQLEGVRDWRDLGRVDLERLRELYGDEIAAQLEALRQITRLLEEAGYIQRTRRGYELTPRAIRRIGQKALREIFQHLKRDRFGQHQIERSGRGGEPSEETKPYEFGDPFLLHLPRTVMNAVQREGPGTPVQLQPADFEVRRTETQTRAATVLMVDMSRSMLYNGCFLAAKKVALALDSLIRTQFPRDTLYIIGFSYLASVLSAEDLPHITWDEYNYGTNMQHGFMLARQLLSRHRGGTRQIILITDGEPTAYFDGEQVRFSYPPTYQTFQETLKEVARCTRDEIVINTFMLERSPYLASFVNEMTRINKGRAFFSTPDHLGEYIVMDYVANKRFRLR
ncbi:VWA domain-containing protein [Thermomicrobium sp. 4228-Ro]|uniref:vWA domain-containing protein n=1 Tax=Thermomicrobium sp. 4228-Ro TaxID=2993937 RepID=UPI002248CC46|nr:VWA domain-containing protein [Thermomicrobium sp. 4228-Ro]MCX2728484.1 VWA domain-containing protein [Thermomicrobium sp. 4228-Ro]